MRTSKTLAALGALLLASSSANAGIIFTLHPPAVDDGDADFEFQLDMQLTAGQTLGVMGLDWLYSGGTGVGPGPQTNVVAGCGFGPNQRGCAFPGMSFTGAAAANTIGEDWLWDGAPGATGPLFVPNIATFTVARQFDNFIIITVGNFEIYDASFQPVTDVTACRIVVSEAVSPCLGNVPEPTTAALLGLGLAALGLVRRRKE